MFESWADSRNDSINRDLERFVFPKPHNLPTSIAKRGRSSRIAVHCAPELRSPVPVVNGGLPAMFWANMPKATVDEDRDFSCGEDNVGPDLQVAKVEPEVLAIAVAKAVEGAAQRNLRLGVGSPDRLHVSRPPRIERRRMKTLSMGLSPSLISVVTGRRHDGTAKHRLASSTGSTGKIQLVVWYPAAGSPKGMFSWL